MVRNAVDSRLISAIGDYYRTLSPQLWSSIDEEINLKESEIFRYDIGFEKKRRNIFLLFSYRPDGTSDPFSESGIIWSFNFFFHNRKLRRILFLTCRADSKISNDSDEEGEPIEYMNNQPTFEG